VLCSGRLQAGQREGEQPIIGIVERQKSVLRAKVMRFKSFRALAKSTPLLGGPSNQ
jgi:hypothetical protein